MFLSALEIQPFPMMADKRVAFADAPGKDLDPIEAEVDAVDIEKDVLALQALRQTNTYRPRRVSRILTAIANEDAARHGYVLAREEN